MKSWRTTVFGVIGICAGAIVAADFGPLITKLAGCLGSMASGVGLLFARDQLASKADRNGSLPIKFRVSPFVLLLGALTAGAQEARPVLGVLQYEPDFPRLFYVSTIQLPGEGLLFEWSDTLGPGASWRLLTHWDTLPPDSPAQLVVAVAPGEWRAQDGQKRLFVRVTGTMGLLP